MSELSFKTGTYVCQLSGLAKSSQENAKRDEDAPRQYADEAVNDMKTRSNGVGHCLRSDRTRLESRIMHSKLQAMTAVVYFTHETTK
jgi:hypothetical protein